MPLDVWNMVGLTTEDQDTMQLRLLKVFAELCQFCGKMDETEPNTRHIDRVYQVLLRYLPQPSLDATSSEEAMENLSFEFSHVECLLFAVHALAKQWPTFLTFPDDPAKLKDFRARLQYLARGTQGYVIGKRHSLISQ